MERPYKIIPALLLLAVLFSAAHASNLGSVAKNDFIVLQEGDDAVFRLLFWTSGEEEQRVVLETLSAPFGWTVTFGDNFFNISASRGNEMVLISGNYISATSVDVRARTGDVEDGVYHVLVSAKSAPLTEGLGFEQERLFNLTVRVGDPLESPGEEKPIAGLPKNTSAEPEQNVSEEPQKAEEEPGPVGDENSAAILGAIILIIFISFLVYKFS